MTARRVLFALLLAASTWVASVGLVGFALAAEDAPPSALPSTFATATPSQDDRFQYEAFQVRLSDEALPVGMGPATPLVAFSWAPPSHIRDGRGTLHQTLELRAVPPGSDSTNRSVGTFHYDGTTRSLVAIGVRHETVIQGTSTYMGVLTSPIWDQDDLTRIDMDLDREEAARGPCGAVHAFQGVARDPRSTIQLFDPCAPTLVAPAGRTTVGVHDVAFRAVDRVEWNDEDAIVFANANGVGVWLAASVPYPLQIVAPSPAAKGVYDVVRLTHLALGSTPLVARAPVIDDDVPTLEWSERTPWGVDDEELSYMFRLQDAYTYARDDPSAPAVREFLDAHPDAYLEYARYDEYKGPNEDGVFEYVEMWHFVVTDGVQRLPVGLVRNEHEEPDPSPIEGVPIPGRGSETVVTYTYENSTTLEGRPVAPAAAPTKMPTLESMFALWKAFDRLTENRGNSYGFHVVEDAAAPSGVGLRLTAGASAIYQDRANGGAWSYTSNSSWVRFDQGGRVLEIIELESYYSNSPRSPVPVPTLEGFDGEAPRDIQLSSIKTSGWSLPPAAAVAGAGALALLVAGAYWVWPWVRAGFGAGLFSRIEAPFALRHATRNDLYTLIRREPGIHFQELQRRTGAGPGPTLHHLRKLVGVGMIVEQQGTGYTCYFAKGAVDRRLMAAVPALKSDGARRLLAAIVATPGRTSKDTAAAALMDASTVTYHVRSLAEAALVVVRKQGRETRLEPTDLGRSALAMHGVGS